MAVQVSYPGVYIEEFAPAPPIQPASTSTAAFIGAAAYGEIKEPTRITSFKQFTETYGIRPLNGFYLWYAVKGYFENGGKDCFVVRASNGSYAQGVMKNDKQDTVLIVRSRQPGKPIIPIDVKIDRTHKVTGKLFKPDSTIATLRVDNNPKKIALVNNGFQFRPGDRIGRASDTPGAVILSVRENTLTLDRELPGLAVGDAVSLGKIQPNDSVIRIKLPTDDPPQESTLVSGAVLSIDPGGTNATSGVVDSVDVEMLVDPSDKSITKTYRITFRDTIGQSFDLPVDVLSEEMTLTVTVGTSSKAYDRLGSDPLHPRYIVDYVNGHDSLVKLKAADPPPVGAPADLLPKQDELVSLGANVPATGDVMPGADEDLVALRRSPTPFNDAIDALAKFPEVTLVAVPDTGALLSQTDRTAVQQNVIAHCEKLTDRFGVLDSFAPDQDPFSDNATVSIETQRGQVVSTRGYVGLYYPWIRVLPATKGPLVSVPPSGHICGLMARVDNSRGVHKAPANETLNGAVELAHDMTNDEQGILNLQGINVIRTFTTKGRPIVFGARTTASDLNWQYVNVRRLFLFLEKSISAGLRSSVFEPNNTELWERLRRVITAFLLTQWRAGALFGAKADEAFYVKIDESLNPFNERALGKLTLEIGVQPTYPAEFIVVRIGIWDGGSSVSE